jgi:protocatechuate 3,4-dioxygenase alpha subunit
MSLQPTTWQTVGPYFRIGFDHLNIVDLAPAENAGERVTVEGMVLDGKGAGVPDAVLEIWQADADGQYRGNSVVTSGGKQSAFAGFGRIPTDDEGKFRFKTIVPGEVPGPGGEMQAPHIAVRVMMRGLLIGLVTRMYFPCERIAADPVLQRVPKQRRRTLIATPEKDSKGKLLWNIELQGERETVFFDC